MAQALGYPCALKYDAGWRTEPRWRECHRLLSMEAKDPDAEHRRLTQILAATWLIGHSDLHRRNLGFLHAEDGSPPSVTIAPLYDVSSARGLKSIDQTLAIGIARQLGLTRIRPRVWIAHADECSLDPEETIEIVRATARRMPDAVAQARDEARSRDENKAQASVDRRVTEILRYAGARHRTFEQALAGMGRRSGEGTGSQTMMPADRGLHRGGIQPTACHQTGCGRIPIIANSGATMAEALASCRRAGDRRSSIGVRERSVDGESRADRIFQPSNDDVTQTIRAAEKPGRFSMRLDAGRCRCPHAHEPTGWASRYPVPLLSVPARRVAAEPQRRRILRVCWHPAGTQPRHAPPCLRRSDGASAHRLQLSRRFARPRRLANLRSPGAGDRVSACLRPLPRRCRPALGRRTRRCRDRRVDSGIGQERLPLLRHLPDGRRSDIGLRSAVPGPRNGGLARG